LQPVSCGKTALEGKLENFQDMILIFTLLVIVLAHFIRGQDKEVKICTPIVTLNLIAVVAE